MEMNNFLSELENVISEIKELGHQTRDNYDDMLHFLSQKSKKFLNNNKKEVQRLLLLRIGKYENVFITTHVWRDKE